MDKLYLGVDLGGTSLSAGVVTATGELLAKASLPTPRGTDEIVSAICAACMSALRGSGTDTGSISSLGIGVPGTIYPQGCVSFACNINMADVPLSEILHERLELPVFLENDANCAAVGEYLAGCGKGASSLLFITIGTGIGGGFIENGRLFRGHNGCGAELGHTVIVHDGRECACGRRGCFETYASTAALIRDCCDYISKYPSSLLASISAERSKVDGHTVFLAMDEGDASATEIFSRYCSYLACGLTNFVNIFQPELICIGGGISKRGDRLLKPVREILMREDYARQCSQRTQLVFSALNDDAGIIGAALLEKLYRNGEHKTT